MMQFLAIMPTKKVWLPAIHLRKLYWQGWKEDELFHYICKNIIICTILLATKAVFRRYSTKNTFPQNLQEKTCVGDKKTSNAGVFLCAFWLNFNRHRFHRTRPGDCFCSYILLKKLYETVKFLYIRANFIRTTRQNLLK